MEKYFEEVLNLPNKEDENTEPMILKSANFELEYNDCIDMCGCRCVGHCSCDCDRVEIP